MSDITTRPDTSTQAYDIAQQNAADARAKSGQYVRGDAQRLAAVGATTAAAPVRDVVGGAPATTQSHAVVNADAPVLPNPQGQAASPDQTMRVVRGSDVFASGGDGVFAALEAASNERQNDVNSAMLVKREQSAIQLTAKQQEFADKKSEIHGMQVSAVTKMLSSGFGLGLSLAVTHKGMVAAGQGGKSVGGEGRSDKSEADGAMWRNAGQNVSGAVDAVHNMLDVNAGGQAEQNKAQLAQKQDAIQAQVAQTNVDSAGAWLDNAKDQRKAAQQAIQTHVQMWGDAVSNVWK